MSLRPYNRLLDILLPCVYFSSFFSDIELSDGTDCVVFSQCDMPNGAFPLMEELRRQGHLIDVTILVGKTQRSIDAHKLVLASTVSTVNTKYYYNSKRIRMDRAEFDSSVEPL